MATVKRIVCLANSRKIKGRCIAGKELSPEDRFIGWVRPVSVREHQEISQEERQYEDGSDPQVLDIINVPMLQARPKDYHQENWLLDPRRQWVKVGRLAWHHLVQLADPVEQLWDNGFSTYNGLNDKISLSSAKLLKNSLSLIQVDRLVISVYAPSQTFSNPKRRVQGRFRYGGTEYQIWITDPDYEQRYLSMSDGHYEIGESMLTISLSEPKKDICYKLIAAIIQREGKPVMSMVKPTVLTIGHSNHSIDKFVGLLRQHGVTAVADVRSVPYSRFNPQFNRQALELSLKEHGIKHVFLGRELGARSDDSSCYESGRVQYSRLARTELFQKGIQRVVRGTTDYRIALMCAEKEPLECHRTVLVAPALTELGITVQHILGNGCLESHDTTMERLLTTLGLPQHDLFLAKAELVAQALMKQEERIAYVDGKLVDDGVGEML